MTSIAEIVCQFISVGLQRNLQFKDKCARAVEQSQ